MYVTDVGISMHDYVKVENALNDPGDIVRATQKLAQDYQKLSEQSIGHYDMHGDNIMRRKRDGKLCLSIIDFGFGFAIERGISRNVLHFLFSGVSFDNALRTQSSIRHCDPVHYNMFVMCFGMLRRTLHKKQNASLQIVRDIIDNMYDFAFEEAVPDNQDPDRKNFNYLQKYIVHTYSDFYTRDNLKGIWKRVCDKTYLVISDFLEHDDGMQKLSARTRRTGTQNIYVPDNYYTPASKVETTFSILFDAFSMAFYNRQGQVCDQNFLRKKFDEYSIANISSFILKKAMHAITIKQDKNPIRNECMKLQNRFSAQIFFLRNDEGGFRV